MSPYRTDEDTERPLVASADIKHHPPSLSSVKEEGILGPHHTDFVTMNLFELKCYIISDGLGVAKAFECMGQRK